MSLFTIGIILFLIMDPVGNISILLRTLNNVPTGQHQWVIVREMLVALFVMLLFYFIGEVLLNFLGISETTVRLSSGAILFIAAIKIIFPNMGNVRDLVRKDEEPFIVPIAIPLVAGPSLLATIMLFAHLDLPDTALLLAMFLAWLAATIILLLSKQFYRLMGENGLIACEKVMGMVLVLLAIQRFLEGLKLFIVHLSL